MYSCTTLNVSACYFRSQPHSLSRKSFRLPQCDCEAIAISNPQIDGNRGRGIYIYLFIGYKNLFEFYSRIEIKSISTNAPNNSALCVCMCVRVYVKVWHCACRNSTLAIAEQGRNILYVKNIYEHILLFGDFYFYFVVVPVWF